jgi:hypothetical protein
LRACAHIERRKTSNVAFVVRFQRHAPFIACVVERFLEQNAGGAHRWKPCRGPQRRAVCYQRLQVHTHAHERFWSWRVVWCKRALLNACEKEDCDDVQLQEGRMQKRMKRSSCVRTRAREPNLPRHALCGQHIRLPVLRSGQHQRRPLLRSGQHQRRPQ